MVVVTPEEAGTGVGDFEIDIGAAAGIYISALVLEIGLSTIVASVYSCIRLVNSSCCHVSPGLKSIRTAIIALVQIISIIRFDRYRNRSNRSF